MTMNLRRAHRRLRALLLLATMGVGAATSDVADAVMRGDSAAVRTLLTQKADVNAPQADGATALHWAVYRDDLATVDLLLKAGANAKAANHYGATPLSLAAENGNAAIAQRLLDAGADANERLLNDDTALMMAARTGNVATMKLLLDRGADVNAKEASRGTTALMWAAAQGHPAAVQLLVDRGADVGAASNPAWHGPARAATPRPPIRGRRRGRNSDTVVSQIGPRNTRDQRGGGLTPLVFAVRAQRSGIGAHSARGRRRCEPGDELRVEPAARRDAEPVLPARRPFCSTTAPIPNIANKGAWSPLYLAVDNRNIEGGDYPLRKPDMDHLDFIKKLLDKGADVNWRVQESTWYRTVFTSQWVHEDGATAFWRASQSSDLVVMKLLLEHGADPNIATTIGVTPLQVAAGIGWVEGVTYEWSKEANVEAVKLLLSLGNDPNAQARDRTNGAARRGTQRAHGGHSAAGGRRRQSSTSETTA